MSESSRKMSKPLNTVLTIILLLAMLAGFTTALRYTIYTAPLGADYYTFYLAGKAVFVDGKNPYSPEVTLQSQMGIYHRPATPQEDQVAYAYPPYALLPLLPIAWLPYDWAEAYWLALNILCLTLIFLFCKPTGNLRIKFLYLLFYPVFFGLILGNFAVSIGTILIFIFLFVVESPQPSRNVQVIAGILLAWATAKPQFLWLFAGFFVIYGLKNRLRAFLIAFFSALAALIAISFILVPNWLSQWVGRIFEYAGYVKSRLTLTHLLMQVFPENTALVLTYILAAVAGLISFWLLLQWWRGRLSPLTMLAWAGFATYLIHPHGIAYEQISFLAPLLIWAASQKRLRQPSVLIFWVGALVFSWVAFAVGKWIYHPVDMWPLLLNGIFVAWLIKKDLNKTLALDPHKG